MSVYDENRRKCPKCGDYINHWESNKCDVGTCMIVTNTKEIRPFWRPPEMHVEEPDRPNIKMTSPRELHDYASTLLSNAVGDWIKDKNDVLLFKQVEYAKALRIAANHIDGVQGTQS